MNLLDSGNQMAKKVSCTCEVCESSSWKVVYSGLIRDGSYGNSVSSEIWLCNSCGVERQIESSCLVELDYTQSNYRQNLKQSYDLNEHYKMHDVLAKFALDALHPYSIRGMTIADVGCGGGALLDNLSSLAKNVIAIDPDIGWFQSLTSRGYKTYKSSYEASHEWANSIDFVFSTQVIEHVLNPRHFLSDIKNLLNDDGILILTTPNRDDILMKIMPDIFPKFFYRRQHRWYFTISSLLKLAEYCNLEVIDISSVHRYGISNMINWLKEKKPFGNSSIEGLNKQLDDFWRIWLETNGMGDNLCLIAKKKLIT
jgi:2-polyprenyl-3-methyl-5-hydroxy-6-metoxy-1,4-benzoquinol methylase